MKEAHVRECVRSSTRELFELASELVRVPSVTGEEDAAQELLAARLREWGLEVDLWRVEPEEVTSHPAYCDDGLPVARLNLVAKWGEGSREERSALALNGHIDVVPPGERHRWGSDPFEARIDGDALYGRGACDMKGGLSACCLALRVAMKLGLTPKRPILLQSVIGEETGGLGTLAAIVRGYRADAAVIAEPTGLKLCPVQAGALSFRLRVPGKAAHGALRTSGVSAIEKFFPIWKKLEALERQRHAGFEHPLFERDRLAAPLSVGKLAAGNWPSTVPEELVAEGRFGVFPGEDCGEARRAFEEAIRNACREDSWLAENPVGVEWFEGQFEPSETDSDAPILEMLRECHRALLGVEPVTHGVSYGSDLRLFTRHAQMPAVLYGPGDVSLAHAANEWVPLDELVRATEVLALLVARTVDA